MSNQSALRLQPPAKSSSVRALELLWALVAKEISIKYKRSVLGILWSFVTPLMLTGVYIYVFAYIYKRGTPGFALFVLSGILPWHFFNLSVMTATNSLVENSGLIRKVLFPRILIPIASVSAQLVNFLIGLCALIIILLFTGRGVLVHLHWLILVIAIETALCLGVSLIMSIWNVYFRDIRQLMVFFTLILFFLTPIVYELSRVPEQIRPLVLMNPLTSIMQSYRSVLYEARVPDLWLLAIGAAEAAAVLAFGLFIFRKWSPKLAREL